MWVIIGIFHGYRNQNLASLFLFKIDSWVNVKSIKKDKIINSLFLTNINLNYKFIQ